MQFAKSLALRLLRTPLGQRLLAAQPLSADGQALARWSAVEDPARGGLRDARYETLEVDLRASGVLHVRLARPRQRNALNMAMWTELEDVFERIGRDARARVVVLRGAGGHFCSGMDLNVFAQMQALGARERCAARQREALRGYVRRFQRIISAPSACRVPVIAGIEGSCIGGAVDLVTACDLRYATAAARFSVKEIDLGIVADIGTLQRLPHLVGDQRTRELSLTGRDFSGEDAAKYGLVLEALESAEALEAKVEAVAEEIAAKSPVAVRGVKKALNYAKEHSTEDALEQVATWNAAMLMGDDLNEAMAATLEKRSPEFPRS